MKNILYINGSPRGEKNSTSALILKDIAGVIQEEERRKDKWHILTLPRSMEDETGEIFRQMDSAEIWILSVPLYVDALPGHVTWWLKQYELHRSVADQKRTIRVYGVINCGFPEAIQCQDALKIMEIFCRKNGMDWRLGIGISMGEVYKQMKNLPLRSFMKSKVLKAYQAILEDLSLESPSSQRNLFVGVRFPRYLYRLMGTMGWKSQARKFGLSYKELYAHPLDNT